MNLQLLQFVFRRFICRGLPFLFMGFMLLPISSADAQRGLTYEQLAMRGQMETNLFFDYFTLPSDDSGNVTFITTFRLDYTMLPFKKSRGVDEERQYFSVPGLSIEVFKSDQPIETPRPDNRRDWRNRRDQISLEGLTPAGRASWRDTVYAATYEQTKSDNLFASGYLKVALEPGQYVHMMQLSNDSEPSERNSRRRPVRIRPYHDKKQGGVILIERISGSSNGGQVPEMLELMNFGKNVYYGKDFYALVHLPGHNRGDAYTLNVHRIDISERDTSNVNQVFTREIASTEIISDYSPRIEQDEAGPVLKFGEDGPRAAYALIEIPNSTFINAVYRVEVAKNGQSIPVAQSIFQSKWIEMPTSLLNIDIAIDMMKYLVDEQTLRNLEKGSSSEKEKKFREFWKQRDPTPETEFNELMAEYYRRIDYTYEQYTTLSQRGYESDRGKVYIKFGPPQQMERNFPPGEAAVEIWTYGGGKKFIFRATSGFGDFRLVESPGTGN